MKLFDLLFVLLVLTGLLALLAAAVWVIRGQLPRARRTVKRVTVGAASYLGLVLVVSTFIPRQTLRPGEPLCFDDWCITVEGVRADDGPTGRAIEVDLRLASRAMRVPQREVGVLVTLLDEQGHEHGPLPPLAGTDQVPLDTLLDPGTSVVATRRFLLPAGSHATALVIAHGGFPIRWFLLGEGPFRGAPLVRLENV